MSSHPDENGPQQPDDRHFIRPYVAASEDSHDPACPAWPSLPEALEETTQPLPRVAPAPPADTGAAAPAPARRGGRLAPAALGLLALAGAGALVLLLTAPDAESPQSSARPDLALPALPARSPGAGETELRNQATTAKPSASATRSPSAPASSKPPTGSASPGRTDKPDTSGTLRPGDKGPEVRALQERLYGQGFTYVRVTGVYDGQTKRGVAQLQRDRDIKGDPSGVYGPATQAAFG